MGGRIASVSDACDFIQLFSGINQDHPWNGCRTLHVPASLMTIGRRLGAIWDQSHHPYWSQPDSQMPDQRSDLFSVQDHLLDPRENTQEGDGVIPWLDENQGVFRFGYRPDDQTLFVHGDWASDSRRDWRPVPDTSLEQGVVIMLLASLFWMSMGEAELHGQSAPRDPRLDVLLFDHPAWDFAGFWTDSNATALFYSGIDQTVTHKRRG